MTFQEEVWSLCSQIPRGRVSTYREIAKAMDIQAYQAVGNALRNNPHAPTVPCHRVVNSDGSLGGYQGEMNSLKKIALLRNEGITVADGMIQDFQEKLCTF